MKDFKTGIGLFKVIKEDDEDIVMKLEHKKNVTVRRIDDEKNVDDIIQIETFTRRSKDENSEG